MAAPDFTPAYPGQIDGAGDVRALYLKIFAGEVLTAFSEKNVFIGRHMIRTISSGKTAQFPGTWKGTASYHTIGTTLVGSNVAANERTISIDDLLVADRFLSNIDEAMSHYDYRSVLSADIGAALARTFDQQVAQVGVLAARASATVTGGNGGTVVTAATARTDADVLVAAIFDAAQALDEKDVPDSDRYVFVKPDQYYLLVNSSSKLINRDYGNEGNGSIAKGTVMQVAGCEVVKTNNLPSTNVTTGPTAYRGDFSDTAALVMQKGATGTVKLIDLAVEAAYQIREQGWFLVGKYAIGHGILRPECAVEISIS